MSDAEISGIQHAAASNGDERDAPPRVLGALLAGGASRRMGAAKAELELGGRPLAAWPAAALRAVTPDVVQVGGEPIAGLGWRVVADRRPAVGPAAGLEAALAAAHGIVVACAVDLPFVTAELLGEGLRRVQAGAVAAAPRWRDRWHPLCGAYARELLPALTSRLDAGSAGLQGFLTEIGAAPIDAPALEAFGDPDRLLLNINTPADLALARSLLDG